MNTQRTTHVRRLAATAALATALGLAGCGGGGDSSSPVALVPGTQVPQSATSSVAGVIAFLMELIADTSETTDPIAVGDAVLFTSETDDPTPIQ